MSMVNSLKGRINRVEKGCQAGRRDGRIIHHRQSLDPARAFCNWLVRQGYVSETLFPKGAVPQAQRGLPHPVEPAAFVHLLRACQLAGSPGGQSAGMTARNRAILWLLRDTGLSVSELCGLRLGDVDRAGGTVTVHRKRGRLRVFPLSADGRRAVCAYLEQARLTPAWTSVVPEAQDLLLLTERRRPLTKNSLTLLFLRLSQRAGFAREPICCAIPMRFASCGQEASWQPCRSSLGSLILHP